VQKRSCNALPLHPAARKLTDTYPPPKKKMLLILEGSGKKILSFVWHLIACKRLNLWNFASRFMHKPKGTATHTETNKQTNKQTIITSLDLAEAGFKEVHM